MIRLEGPRNANILVVGDCPYGVDERNGRYFQGYTGDVLDKLFREAGIDRSQCLLTTIAKAKPPGDNLEFFFEDKRFFKPREYWTECVNELQQTIAELQPNMILALGATSMYYLTGNKGINSFRGYISECSLVPGIKVLPIIHPATINADWKLFFQTVMDVRKAVRNSVSKGMPPDKRILTVDPPISQLFDYCDYLIHEHKGSIGLDVETMTGAHIDIIGFAESPFAATSFNFMTSDGAGNRNPRFDLNLETKIWSKFAEVIEKKDLIMQNGKYDSGVLWNHNKIYCADFTKDIMVAAHAVWPECPRSLGFLASICLNVPPWKHTAQESPGLYNAADACNTVGIWNALEREMEKSGTRITHDFEIAQNEVACMMELQGLLIDRDRQKVISDRNHKRMAEVKQEIDTAIGRELNFNSPKQVNQLLYEEMALPKQFKRRKGKGEATLTSGADALAVLCRLSDAPVLKKIAEYKKITKLLTFVDCSISPQNTVHTCYNITGANMAHEDNKGIVTDDDDAYRSFGRWSSSGSIIKPYGSGNLQNIPGEAREMYCAGDGKVFLQADYKQAEAVAVAYLIGDEKLKSLFKASFGLSDEICKERNLDIHKITAASMAGYSVEFTTNPEGEMVVLFSHEVSPEDRKKGKTIRHAKNYSAGPGVLATKLGIGLPYAKQLMAFYDAANPELPKWQKEVIQGQLQQNRTLTNLFGRIHKFLDRWGDDLFRSAYSYIPQSSIGDLLNAALVILYNDFGSELDIAIQLHDAIYVIVDDTPEAIARGKWILRHCMIDRVQPLRTPAGEEFWIDTDFKVAKYWGELHD